jgi:hypothetical protein
MGVHRSHGSSPQYDDIELTFRIVIWSTNRGPPLVSVFTFVAIGPTIAVEEVARGETTQTAALGADTPIEGLDTIVLEPPPPRSHFVLDSFLPPREKSRSDAEAASPL